ncbi:MAG: cell division protein ZipA C-terminal FtsZ-binding domain-containing protein [Betaproteobacteria bacterium]|nr:cell division protein ZipA C-terminal FtsZ-binding domain-containing protein [Betaproteobacteria bacterium]
MPDNELLYGLIGLGAAGVFLVLGYNSWQERKHRRSAEQAFRADIHDVLLEGHPEERNNETRIEPSVPESIEPSMPERIEPAASRIPAAAPIGRAAEPELPAEAAAIDCVVRIEAPAGIQGGALVTSAGGPLSQVNRPIHWYALSEETHRWLPLSADEPRSFTRFAVALQLADRRGAISERDYDNFVAVVQRVCDQFLAVPQIGERKKTLALAQQVDQFCAATDIQIALNVLAGGQAFVGTKIRGLAEAAGLKLERDGCFHARDDEGRTLFALSNRDPALFSVEALKQMASTGVTLTINVPRVGGGIQSFDKMVAFARHLVETLDGVLADDNRKPLGDPEIALIRSQVQDFLAQMETHGIPAGSALALRLFA